MKTILAVLFSCFLLGSSCRKEKLYWGYVNAQKNGASWSAKVRGINSTLFAGKFNIAFEKFNANDILIETLGFATIPQSTGRYRVFKRDFTFQDPQKTTSSFYTLSDDGDVLCDRYHVIETDSVNNYIQIDNYNQGNNEVKGRFAIRLVIRLPKCNSTAPDTLTFLNGEFHTKIK